MSYRQCVQDNVFKTMCSRIQQRTTWQVPGPGKYPEPDPVPVVPEPDPVAGPDPEPVPVIAPDPDPVMGATAAI